MMAIASWMDSSTVMPGIEVAVRRTEEIEAAAKAIEAVTPDTWLGMPSGAASVPLGLLHALRMALRGEE